ncbi:MAG TPA: OmpA family protein [Sphingomonas sp.]|nr:OmpA family protein [Sphingomonas sp.]
MPFSRKFIAAVSAPALLATAGCVTNPETGQRQLSKAGIGAIGGAAGGALLGTLVGGRHSRTEALVGAGIGALAGGAVGAYMDNQEKKLRAETAGSGVEVERDGDQLILRIPSGITFATNSYTIEPPFQATLDKVARTLADYPQTFVDVYGFTDSTGTDAINQPLSENRARSVADYLSSHGVNPARIAIRGYGSAYPVASNATPEGRAQNRRVEIKLTPVTQQGM